MKVPGTYLPGLFAAKEKAPDLDPETLAWILVETP